MGDKPIDRGICETMFRDLEQRGSDACGIALVDQGRVTVKKTGVESSVALARWKDMLEITPTTTMVLMHTRAATQGSTEIPANNHPIIGEQMILLHNGIVDSNKRGYGESDSGQLLWAMEHHGIERALARASGWLAVAFLNYYRPNKLKLYRYSSPLDVGWDASNKHFYFASDATYFNCTWAERHDSGLWGLFTGLECVTLDPEVLLTVIPAAGRVTMQRVKHKAGARSYYSPAKTTVEDVLSDKLSDEDLEIYDKLLQTSKPVNQMTDREWKIWHAVEELSDPEGYRWGTIYNGSCLASYGWSSYAAKIRDPHLYTYRLPQDRERGLDPAFTKHSWKLTTPATKVKGSERYLKGSGLYKADGTEIPTVSGACLPATTAGTMAEAQALAAELERCDELS